MASSSSRVKTSLNDALQLKQLSDDTFGINFPSAFCYDTREW